MSYDQNIARIKAVHHALGDLADKVVYVGGTTVALYNDRAAGEARVTEDVDLVIELINYRGFAGVEEKLRARGFVNDQDSGVICRFRIKGIIVDIMPTNEDVLGFKNKWYPEGFVTSQWIQIDEAVQVRIFRPEYFLASKLEAFNDRANGDGRMSTDFEDIVYLLNNRRAIWDEIEVAGDRVKDYIVKQFQEFLNNDYLEEWISGHLDFVEQKRVGIIIGGMRACVGK